MNRALHTYTGLYIAMQGYTQLYTHNTQLNGAIHTYTGLYRAIQSHTLLNRAIHRKIRLT